jgi:hypothetical protein
MVRPNVDLFDFVVDDHHESSDPVLDYGDRGVVHSLSSPPPERIFVTRLDQLLGHVPEMAVAPSEMPDLLPRDYPPWSTVHHHTSLKLATIDSRLRVVYSALRESSGEGAEYIDQAR